MQKIGITLNLPNNICELFNNGIRQNVLFLSELLINIGKYDVCFIIDNIDVDMNNTIADKRIAELRKYITVNYIPYRDVLNYKFDLIISFGYIIDEEKMKATRLMGGTRHVFYNVANRYIIETEDCIYSNKDQLTLIYKRHKYFDECWNIPQMCNTNKHYIQTLLRCSVKDVPFIWSPVLIDSEQNKYVKRAEEKSIAIMEPNLSIMKWAFPALLVCENAYRDNELGGKIKHVYICNAECKDADFLKNLNKIVESLDLKRDSKLSIEKRYNALSFMERHSDIVVSHTWENWLNYLYLDLAWMGWPIVHNGKLCKEVGYYYDEFHYEMGGEVLKDAILNHDKNAHEYLVRNRAYMQKYLPTNTELKSQYEILISNVLART